MAESSSTYRLDTTADCSLGEWIVACRSLEEVDQRWEAHIGDAINKDDTRTFASLAHVCCLGGVARLNKVANLLQLIGAQGWIVGVGSDDDLLAHLRGLLVDLRSRETSPRSKRVSDMPHRLPAEDVRYRFA